MIWLQVGTATVTAQGPRTRQRHDQPCRAGTFRWPPANPSTWPTVGTFSWHRTDEHLLLRGSLAVAEADEREHERPAARLLAEGNRPRRPLRGTAQGSPGRAKQPSTQVPELGDSRNGLRSTTVGKFVSHSCDVRWNSPKHGGARFDEHSHSLVTAMPLTACGRSERYPTGSSGRPKGLKERPRKTLG